MENKENYSYCKVLNLEEAKKEFASCFDSSGNVINREKHKALMENSELIKYLFSDEKMMERAKQEEDLQLKATGENFLNKAFPPSWYWEMPDYYYAGLFNENLKNGELPGIIKFADDCGKLRYTITRNEAVLNDCGWERKEYDSLEYYNRDFPNIKLVFDGEDSVFFVAINQETGEELSRFKIPFALLCGMFLKCRELDYKKPWQLRAHDYKNRHPKNFEEEHGIIRDENTKEIIDYGTWVPEKTE